MNGDDDDDCQSVCRALQTCESNARGAYGGSHFAESKSITKQAGQTIYLYINVFKVKVM